MATTREQIPIVVNRHHFRNKQIPEPSLYVGRGTPLGNPFTVQKHGPGALELYRRHLWQKIRGRDVAVLAAMGAITAKHSLVCSCKPRPCHGDVIVRAWVWMQGEPPCRGCNGTGVLDNDAPCECTVGAPGEAE